MSEKEVFYEGGLYNDSEYCLLYKLKGLLGFGVSRFKLWKQEKEEIKTTLDQSYNTLNT